MQQVLSGNRGPRHVSWRFLLAVSAALWVTGNAAAADRVVLAEAFVDDG